MSLSFLIDCSYCAFCAAAQLCHSLWEYFTALHNKPELQTLDRQVGTTDGRVQVYSKIIHLSHCALHFPLGSRLAFKTWHRNGDDGVDNFFNSAPAYASTPGASRGAVINRFFTLGKNNCEISMTLMINGFGSRPRRSHDFIRYHFQSSVYNGD